MKRIISFNFANTLEEMEDKKVKFCFTNKFLFLKDKDGKVYQLGIKKIGSYLDSLIKSGETVEFEYIEKPLNLKINEVWDSVKAKNFMAYI